MKWDRHEIGQTWNGMGMKWDRHEMAYLWHELGLMGMKWDGNEKGRAWIRTVGHEMGWTWNGTGMKWPGMNWPAWIGPTWNGRAWNGINPGRWSSDSSTNNVLRMNDFDDFDVFCQDSTFTKRGKTWWYLQSKYSDRFRKRIKPYHIPSRKISRITLE